VTISPSPTSAVWSPQGERPHFADGALQLLQSAMADSLSNDMETLAVLNAYGSDSPESRIRQIPYIFVAPGQRKAIGELALNVQREKYGGLKGLRARDFAVLARLTGEVGTTKGELLSYIFFSPDFLRELIAMGRTDARRWSASARGPDGLWRLGPRSERLTAV
jgi:NTE family protein